MKVNFMSSKDNGDGQFMDSNQLFESLLSSYQIGLKELMKD